MAYILFTHKNVYMYVNVVCKQRKLLKEKIRSPLVHYYNHVAYLRGEVEDPLVTWLLLVRDDRLVHLVQHGLLLHLEQTVEPHLDLTVEVTLAGKVNELAVLRVHAGRKL